VNEVENTSNQVDEYGTVCEGLGGATGTVRSTEYCQPKSGKVPLVGEWVATALERFKSLPLPDSPISGISLTFEAELKS
jgi:hypothetical protein